MHSDLFMNIGDKVIAKIEMVNDLRDEGMDIELCAHAGDELIIRGKSQFDENVFYVSHEHILNRSFCASADELESTLSNAR
jgi:hypothetical protein